MKTFIVWDHARVGQGARREVPDFTVVGLVQGQRTQSPLHNLDNGSSQADLSDQASAVRVRLASEEFMGGKIPR